MSTTKIVELDIWNSDINSGVGQITAVQGEVDSRFIEIHLIDKAKSIPYDLTNKEIIFNAIKPDKFQIYNRIDVIDALNGIGVLKLTSQMSAFVGDYISCEINILGFTPQDFMIVKGINITILPTIGMTNIESTSEFTALENALLDINGKVSDVEVNGVKLIKNNGVVNVLCATPLQGTKAESAIQGIQVNNIDLTPDANKKVNVLCATPTQGIKADNAIPMSQKGVTGGVAAFDSVNSQFSNLVTSCDSYYEKCTSTDTNALQVIADTGTPTSTQIKLSSVTPHINSYTPVVGDYVRTIANGLKSEVIDGRINNDGFINSSIGEHIRNIDKSFTNAIYDPTEIDTEISKNDAFTITGSCYVNQWYSANASYSIYFYPVTEGKKYRITGITYGSAKTVVTAMSTSNDGKAVVADNSEGTTNRNINVSVVIQKGFKYVALSMPTASIVNFHVYEESLKSKIDTLNTKLTNFINRYSNTIIVDKNGNGDFTTIQSAVMYLLNNFSKTELNRIPRTIFVRNGVYTENPRDSDPYGAIPKLANKVSIIGESRDGVIINCHISSTVQGKCIEAGGESTIENLTVNMLNDGTYTRDNDLGRNPYCLHNDDEPTDNGATPYYTTVRNCKFYSEGHTPIGAGLHNNQTQRYENVECIYNSNVFTEMGALYVHGCASSTAIANGVEIDNCTLISKNGAQALNLPNVAGSQQYTDIPVSVRRTIGTTTGSTLSNISKTTHLITKDSALNNISECNY